MEQKKVINPLAYTICIRNHHGFIEVSQPDLEIYEAIKTFRDISNGSDIGELVLSVMGKVRRRCDELSQAGQSIAPSSPKSALNIPLVDWVGITGAAKFLGISESTVRRICDNGVIPFKRSRQGRKILLKDLQFYKRSGGLQCEKSIAENGSSQDSTLKLSFFESLFQGKKGPDQPAM